MINCTGHSTASICHLGNIAMRLKRKLKWDPEKEQFISDDEANQVLQRPYRAPWEILNGDCMPTFESYRGSVKTTRQSASNQVIALL